MGTALKGISLESKNGIDGHPSHSTEGDQGSLKEKSVRAIQNDQFGCDGDPVVPWNRRIDSGHRTEP